MAPTACGHCRHHKVKCVAQCKYKPYFPPESNTYPIVVKIYRSEYLRDVLLTLVDEGKRVRAFENIIREARLRAEDPVYGSIGKIDELEVASLLRDFRHPAGIELEVASLLHGFRHPAGIDELEVASLLHGFRHPTGGPVPRWSV
ncbi:hypothetical protein L6452_41598 [Arctium lappa]|uniref:Uncharacterized protein n=1 Tax=Arctium lappa TaxID=4217 RepID=A0ACB8XQY6_ARCLA|nr:hypothetical protein L6452_41598 [Arctium lappa]